MQKMSLLKRWFVAGLLGSAVLLTGIAQAQTLKVGDKAPAFSVISSTGNPVALTDYIGKKNVVLFFYVGAFTDT